MEAHVQPSIYIKARPQAVFDVARWIAQHHPQQLKAATAVAAPEAHHELPTAAASHHELPTAAPHHELPTAAPEQPHETAAAAAPEQQHETAVAAAAATVAAAAATVVTAEEAKPKPSSGDWKAEYALATKEEERLKTELQHSQENVEVYRRMLQHSAASMDKWKRHAGMTELEAQAQMNNMLQHTQELNAELQKSQHQQEQLQQRLSRATKERNELMKMLQRHEIDQRQTLHKLDTVEHQLEQNRQQLGEYRAVMVERARQYIKDKNDEEVRQRIAQYRQSVLDNQKGDATLKQLNLQGAAILELLLQQRALAQQLNPATAKK